MINPYYAPSPPAPFDPAILAFHRSLPGYHPTPLHDLGGRFGNCAQLLVKDESQRFGLRAFKALGASWAIHRFLRQHPGRHTFACATAGNHGRAVAWTARRLGHDAVVYMPRDSAAARVAAIAAEGARVVLVDGTYDDAVELCARENGTVISDTAYEGYTDIPLTIMEGYRTLLSEVTLVPDIVFVQAGVGGLAYAVVRHFGGAAEAVVVEPAVGACCLASCASEGGERVAVTTGKTLMGCLNCGVPSLAAWPVLRTGVRHFVMVGDESATQAQHRLCEFMDSGINGAAGFAAVLASPELVAGKRVLAINTEGDVNRGVD